jgi:hypothetical protein
MLAWTLSLDLDAVHHAALAGVEWIAPMNQAAVVPYQGVPDAPLVPPHKLRARSVRPELVQQALAFFQGQPDNVAIAATAEIQRFAPRYGVGPKHRMAGTGSLPRIGDLLETLAQLPRAVVSLVMHQ